MVVSAIFTIIINSPTQRKSETIDRSILWNAIPGQTKQSKIYLLKWYYAWYYAFTLGVGVVITTNAYLHLLRNI